MIKLKSIHYTKVFLMVLFFHFLITSCIKSELIKPVTNSDFQNFVEATGYITDAEKFGWSIVQKTVYEYEVVYDATWKKPNGIDNVSPNLPVTQVSFNDAMAYCDWAKVRLPSYEKYWELTKSDSRLVNIDANSIMTTVKANIIGNTWDITTSNNDQNEIRLAGGSYLCSPKTCDGTNRNRMLFVSYDTGNSNISFSVISK